MTFHWPFYQANQVVLSKLVLPKHNIHNIESVFICYNIILYRLALQEGKVDIAEIRHVQLQHKHHIITAAHEEHSCAKIAFIS